MKKILVLIAVLSLFYGQAMAAVTANSVVTCQTPNRGLVQFLQGTDTAGTYKTLYTAGTNGSVIRSLHMDNNDGSATHLVTCQIINSTVKYGGVALTTVSNAGFTSGTVTQNMMTPSVFPGLPVDSDGNPYLLLSSGDTLQCTYATTLTSATWIDVHTQACDF